MNTQDNENTSIKLMCYISKGNLIHGGTQSIIRKATAEELATAANHNLFWTDVLRSDLPDTYVPTEMEVSMSRGRDAGRYGDISDFVASDYTNPPNINAGRGR